MNLTNTRVKGIFSLNFLFNNDTLNNDTLEMIQVPILGSHHHYLFIKCHKTKRLAVVIGNSEYKHMPKLTNAVNDANAIKDTFHSLGFEVLGENNLERYGMLKCFGDILDSWKHEAKEIVVYYSGHGMSIDGKVYLAPSDAYQSSSSKIMEQGFLDMDIIINSLLENRGDDEHPIIIILDCCRSEFGHDNRHNCNKEYPLQNMAILYSTAGNSVASDGYSKNEHSPYTQTLLEYMVKDLTIDEIQESIAKNFGNSSEFRGKQIPWMEQTLFESYRFCPPKPFVSNCPFKKWSRLTYFLIGSLILLSLLGLYNQATFGANPKDDTLGFIDTSAEGQILSNLYGIPSKNNEFADRPKILAEIKKILEKPSTEANILALYGLGGMGKTQMMLHYSYFYRTEYDFIFWLEVDGWAMALDSFRKLAVNLGLNEKVAKREYSDEKIICWVRNWLEKETRWLLLLNNADETTVMKIFDVLPRIGGDIILTTREHISSKKAKLIKIEKMNEDEALTMLLGTTTMNSIDRDSEEFRNAKEIITELDSMPLAIDLARAYVEDMQISFKEYLDMFKDQRQRFILSYKDNSDQYNHTLATVWQLSFEQIRTQNSLAGFILDVCTFLQPDTIPINFIERQYSILKNASNLPSLSSDTDIRSAIALLVRFSFLARTLEEDIMKEDDTLTIHRLVQKITLNAMSDEQKISWGYSLAAALNKEMEFSDSYAPATRAIMNIYLSHVRHFVTILSDFSQNPLLSQDLQELLERTVEYQLDNGDLFGVETLANITVMISKSMRGVNNVYTWKALSIFARYYQEKGRYADAEPLYRQALAISEDVLGPDDSITATSLNNLASLYIKLGNYSDTEQLFQRALAIREKTLGDEDPETATSLNNLALLYIEQGNYTKAKPLFERALEITEKKLGLEHPDTAVFLNSLASLYESQGNYANAERLYKRALTIRKKKLGIHHPETAVSMSNLAFLHIEQGNYANAELMFQKALKINEKILGPEHPDTATSLNNLALLHMGQGNYADTKLLFQRALAIMKKALGSEHQDTAASINNLAFLHFKQGNYIDAERMFLRTLEIIEKELGPEHPSVAVSLNNLALLYERQGNYTNAEPLYKRALAIREKTLKTLHPETAASMNNLALLYSEQGDYTNADLMFQKALEIMEKKLGPEHLETAVTLNNLASLYESQGNYAKAKLLYQRTLATEKALGYEQQLYKIQGNYVCTKPLYQQVLIIMEKTSGPEHPGIVSSLNSLTPLYMEQGIIPMPSCSNGSWRSRRDHALSIR